MCVRDDVALRVPHEARARALRDGPHVHREDRAPQPHARDVHHRTRRLLVELDRALLGRRELAARRHRPAPRVPVVQRPPDDARHHEAVDQHPQPDEQQGAHDPDPSTCRGCGGPGGRGEVVEAVVGRVHGPFPTHETARCGGPGGGFPTAGLPSPDAHAPRAPHPHPRPSRRRRHASLQRPGPLARPSRGRPRGGPRRPHPGRGGEHPRRRSQHPARPAVAARRVRRASGAAPHERGARREPSALVPRRHAHRLPAQGGGSGRQGPGLPPAPRRGRGRAPDRSAAGRHRPHVAARRLGADRGRAAAERPPHARRHQGRARAPSEGPRQGARHRGALLPLLGHLAHHRRGDAPLPPGSHAGACGARRGAEGAQGPDPRLAPVVRLDGPHGAARREPRRPGDRLRGHVVRRAPFARAQRRTRRAARGRHAQEPHPRPSRRRGPPALHARRPRARLRHVARPGLLRRSPAAHALRARERCARAGARRFGPGRLGPQPRGLVVRAGRFAPAVRRERGSPGALPAGAGRQGPHPARHVGLGHGPGTAEGRAAGLRAPDALPAARGRALRPRGRRRHASLLVRRSPRSKASRSGPWRRSSSRAATARRCRCS